MLRSIASRLARPQRSSAAASFSLLLAAAAGTRTTAAALSVRHLAPSILPSVGTSSRNGRAADLLRRPSPFLCIETFRRLINSLFALVHLGRCFVPSCTSTAHSCDPARACLQLSGRSRRRGPRSSSSMKTLRLTTRFHPRPPRRRRRASPSPCSRARSTPTRCARSPATHSTLPTCRQSRSAY